MKPQCRFINQYTTLAQYRHDQEEKIHSHSYINDCMPYNADVRKSISTLHALTDYDSTSYIAGSAWTCFQTRYQLLQNLGKVELTIDIKECENFVCKLYDINSEARVILFNRSRSPESLPSHTCITCSLSGKQAHLVPHLEAMVGKYKEGP